MHLVRDAIRPFDVVVARRLGSTLLYDSLDEGLGAGRVSEAVRDSLSSSSGELRESRPSYGRHSLLSRSTGPLCAGRRGSGEGAGPRSNPMPRRKAS